MMEAGDTFKVRIERCFDEISGAVISEDQVYRFALWRIWDRSRNFLLFIGLNGSTAGPVHDDPSVVRLINFAKKFGYGGLFIGNLSPYRAVYTTYVNIRLNETKQAIRQNFEAIKEMRGLCSDTLVGWGNTGRFMYDRIDRILGIVGDPVYCIKVNQSGEPCHPLYLPYRLNLKPYRREVKDKVVSEL